MELLFLLPRRVDALQQIAATRPGELGRVLGLSGMSISDDASRISRALVADLLASHAAQEQALRAEIVRLEQELSAMTTAAWMHAAKLHQHEQALSG